MNALPPPSQASTDSMQPEDSSPAMSWAVGLLLALALPLVWILSGWFQLFQPPGWVDPGIYLGYFLGISERIASYGANYFSMRLPFTALGAALYSLFPPELAQKLLIVFFNSLAALSLFIIVSRRHSIVAGVFASWWLTLNPLWIASITRGYIDGPAMALLMASLALLDQRERWPYPRLAIVTAGAFAASAAFTHPIMVVLFGLAALADIAVSRPRIIRLGVDLLLLLIGAIAATIALGLVSQLVGGKFLFFLADSQAFTRSLEGFGSNYRYSLREWTPNAFRLAPLAASLVLGALILVRNRTTPFPTLVVSGLVLAGGISGFLLFWDYGVGGATLQSSFYASYALVGQALIFGATGGVALRSARRPALIATALLTLAVALLMLAQADEIWAFQTSIGNTAAWLAIAALFAVAGAVLFTRIRLAAVGLVIAATTLAGILNVDTRRIFSSEAGVDFATTFRSTMAVASLVDEHADPSSRLVFWFDRESLTEAEQHRSFFTLYQLRFRETVLRLNYWDSLVALWLWDRSLLGGAMPALDADQLERLKIPGSLWTVVTLCLQPAQCDAGLSSLTDQGLQATEIARQLIDEGYVPFTAVVYAVEAGAEDPVGRSN